MTGYLAGFLIRGELHGLGLLSVNKPFLAACASVHVAPLVSQIARVLKNDGRIFTMTYEEFKRKIIAYIEKAGISKTVFFDHDTESKLYSAKIPGEELRITCRESGLGMTVHFHQRTLPVPQGI